MNKFWTAAAISLAATAAQAANNSWVLVASGANAQMAFFVETTTYARSGNLVTYWWYAQGKGDGSLNVSNPMIRAVRAKTEMDCARRRYRLLSEINYNANGQVLESAQGATQWDEVVPGTTFGGSADAVCDPKFTHGGASGTVPVGDDLKRAAAVWFETTARGGATR